MQRIYEELELMTTLSSTASSTPAVGAWISAVETHELLAIFVTADMANETLDFKVEQATDISGTGVKDLKAATQIAASAAANDQKVIYISIRTDQLDGNNGFKFVRTRALTGGATGGIVTQLLLSRSTYKPASNAATLVQTAVL